MKITLTLRLHSVGEDFTVMLFPDDYVSVQHDYITTQRLASNVVLEDVIVCDRSGSFTVKRIDVDGLRIQGNSRDVIPPTSNLLERLHELASYPDKCVRDRASEVVAELTRCQEQNTALRVALESIKVRVALESINDRVCGDKISFWSDPEATLNSRKVIADLCDLSLSDAEIPPIPPSQN